MRAAEGVFMAMFLKMNVGDVTVALRSQTFFSHSDLQNFTLGFERQCTDNVKPKFFIFRAWDIGQCRKIIPSEISCVLLITSCVCTAGKCTAYRLERNVQFKQGKEAVSYTHLTLATKRIV